MSEFVLNHPRIYHVHHFPFVPLFHPQIHLCFDEAAEFLTSHYLSERTERAWRISTLELSSLMTV